MFGDNAYVAKVPLPTLTGGLQLEGPRSFLHIRRAPQQLFFSFKLTIA